MENKSKSLKWQEGRQKTAKAHKYKYRRSWVKHRPYPSRQTPSIRQNLDKHPNQGGVVLQVAASCEGNLGGHLAWVQN